MSAPRGLTIALATTDDRLEAIELDRLPADARWRYIVVCQCAADATARLDAWAAAAAAGRPDVSLVRLQGRGVAASRNAAIDLCDTEALLFTDDDVGLRAPGLARILAAFAADPSLCLLAGQTLRADGRPAKAYPRRPHRLTHFNSARIGTVELAVRVGPLRRKQVRFDTAFGAGTACPLGDEFVFVTDCLKAGLRGAYHPTPIAIHSGMSSGLTFAGTAESRARVFERVFSRPLVSLVKLAFLARHWRRFDSAASLVRFARAFLRSHSGGSPTPQPQTAGIAAGRETVR